MLSTSPATLGPIDVGGNLMSSPPISNEAMYADAGVGVDVARVSTLAGSDEISPVMTDPSASSVEEDAEETPPVGIGGSLSVFSEQVGREFHDTTMEKQVPALLRPSSAWKTVKSLEKNRNLFSFEKESSPLLAAPENRDLVSLDQVLQDHLANFTRKLDDMLDKTRDALGRGDPLHTVMAAVFNEAAQCLLTDRPDVDAAVTAAVHFYSGMTTSVMRKMVGQDKSALMVAPSAAVQDALANPTDDSSTPPAIHELINFGGALMPRPPVPLVALHTVAAVGVDGTRKDTIAGPAEIAPAISIPSLPVGMKAVATVPAGADESDSFLSDKGGREFNDTIIETSTLDLPRPSGGGAKERRPKKSCDECSDRKVACRSSQVGAECDRCRRKNIPCVFSLQRIMGRKPGTKRSRDKIQTLPLPAPPTRVPSITPDDPRAVCAAFPSSHGSSIIGRRLPSVDMYFFDAPTARGDDSSPKLSIASPASIIAAAAATVAAAVAVAAAEVPDLPQRYDSGCEIANSRSKRHTRDAVDAYNDLSISGECSFAEGVNGSGDDRGSRIYARCCSSKKARGTAPALSWPPGMF